MKFQKYFKLLIEQFPYMLASITFFLYVKIIIWNNVEYTTAYRLRPIRKFAMYFHVHFMSFAGSKCKKQG